MTTLLQAADEIEDVDPATHGVLHVLDRTGDTKIIWDRSNPEEVDNARQTFARLVTQKKFVAYSVNQAGDKGEVVRDFDPAAEKLILTPPLVGG